MDGALDSCDGGDASRLSIAERRSARRESNSHVAAWRAASLPWNSRSRALRASGMVACSWDWRSSSIDSLSLRVSESGKRVVRALVKMDSRCFWAAVRVSSGEMRGLDG